MGGVLTTRNSIESTHGHFQTAFNVFMTTYTIQSESDQVFDSFSTLHIAFTLFLAMAYEKGYLKSPRLSLSNTETALVYLLNDRGVKVYGVKSAFGDGLVLGCKLNRMPTKDNFPHSWIIHTIEEVKIDSQRTPLLDNK